MFVIHNQLAQREKQHSRMRLWQTGPPFHHMMARKQRMKGGDGPHLWTETCRGHFRSEPQPWHLQLSVPSTGFLASVSKVHMESLYATVTHYTFCVAFQNFFWNLSGSLCDQMIAFFMLTKPPSYECCCSHSNWIVSSSQIIAVASSECFNNWVNLRMYFLLWSQIITYPRDSLLKLKMCSSSLLSLWWIRSCWCCVHLQGIFFHDTVQSTLNCYVMLFQQPCSPLLQICRKFLFASKFSNNSSLLLWFLSWFILESVPVLQPRHVSYLEVSCGWLLVHCY